MSVLICFSGGLDSMVLTKMVKPEDLSIVHFVYTHPATVNEQRAVIEWRHKNTNVRDWEIILNGVQCNALSKGPGFKGPRVVPGRNAIFISHAINIAASHDISQVWYGANKDDQIDYFDCRPEWVEMMSKLAAPFGVSVHAPLIEKTRFEVKKMADEFGVSDWWSCYQPVAGLPCGTCQSCGAS